MTSARATIRVRVIPRAAHARLTFDDAGTLRVHLTAPPVEGAANRALVALLADTLRVPKRDVVIARGEHGRDKIVVIRGRTEAQIAAAIAAGAASNVDKAPRGG